MREGKQLLVSLRSGTDLKICKYSSILNPLWLLQTFNFFLPFTDKQHADMFLQYLNNQHENITFTLECEANNALSFLDVKVSRNNN